jgi:hypothetical protein
MLLVTRIILCQCLFFFVYPLSFTTSIVVVAAVAIIVVVVVINFAIAPASPNESLSLYHENILLLPEG